MGESETSLTHRCESALFSVRSSGGGQLELGYQLATPQKSPVDVPLVDVCVLVSLVDIVIELAVKPHRLQSAGRNVYAAIFSAAVGARSNYNLASSVRTGACVDVFLLDMVGWVT